MRRGQRNRVDDSAQDTGTGSPLGRHDGEPIRPTAQTFSGGTRPTQTDMPTRLKRAGSIVCHFSKDPEKVARMILSFFQATFHTTSLVSPVFADCKLAEYRPDSGNDAKAFVSDPTIHFFT